MPRNATPIAQQRDLGTASARTLQSCQVCQHRYAFQNKGLATCAPPETQQHRTKRRTNGKSTPQLFPPLISARSSFAERSMTNAPMPAPLHTTSAVLATTNAALMHTTAAFTTVNAALPSTTHLPCSQSSGLFGCANAALTTTNAAFTSASDLTPLQSLTLLTNLSFHRNSLKTSQQPILRPRNSIQPPQGRPSAPPSTFPPHRHL